MPTAAHTPAVFETVQDHLEMIADHGHSHGFEEDVYWAIHGHSHDVADHDHNQAFLMAQARPKPYQGFCDLWRSHEDASGSSLMFRIDRPPRV